MAEFELKVPYDLRNTSVVEGFVDLLPFDKKPQFVELRNNMKSVLNEAFVNVIRHTPSTDKEHGVSLYFDLKAMSLRIELKDTGRGIFLNNQYPPFATKMINHQFPFIFTIDGVVKAHVKDKRTVSLFFEPSDLKKIPRSEIVQKSHDGGMGISIMVKIMDVVEFYYSDKNVNHLKMIKKFHT